MRRFHILSPPRHPDTPNQTQARALLAPDADGRTAATYNQAVDQLIAYRALLEEHDAVDNPAAVPTSSLALPSPSDDVAARWRRRLLREGGWVRRAAMVDTWCLYMYTCFR